jgi:hypothetical protein
MSVLGRPGEPGQPGELGEPGVDGGGRGGRGGKGGRGAGLDDAMMSNQLMWHRGQEDKNQASRRRANWLHTGFAGVTMLVVILSSAILYNQRTHDQKVNCEKINHQDAQIIVLRDESTKANTMYSAAIRAALDAQTAKTYAPVKC